MLRRLLIAAVSFSILLLLAACSSGGGEPDESSLRKAISDYISELQNGEPLRAYDFASESYKDKCDATDFAGALILLDAFLGESWRDAETRIESVEIDGTRAEVVYDLYLDDSALGFGDGDNYWIHEDGKWRFATDDPDPCGSGASSSNDTPTPTDDRADRTATAAPEPTAEPTPRPSPTPEPVGGSRNNPIPLGSLVNLSDGWTVTVVSSTPNGTDAVLAENQFNDPPDAGNQFFIARLTATYNGAEESSTLDASFRFNAVGAANVTYEQFSASCGVVPDEIDSYVEVFQGGTIEGNICWQIRSSDADSLVAFDDPFLFDGERVWFAVLP